MTRTIWALKSEFSKEKEVIKKTQAELKTDLENPKTNQKRQEKFLLAE